MKSKKGAIGIIMVVIVVAALIGGGFWVFNSQDGDSGKTATGEDLKPTSQECEVEPYIKLTATDPYSGGVATGVGMYGILNPVTSGDVITGDYIGTVTSGSSGTTFSKGDSVALIVGAANYINHTEMVSIKNCGANNLNVDLFATDAGTLDLRDDSSVKVSDTATATGAVTNVTSAAGNIVFKAELRGVTDSTTGKLLVTMEGNDTQIDDFSVTGNNILDDDYNDATGLSLFAAEGTSPTVKMAFIVDEILDAGVQVYDVSLSPETGKTIGEGTVTSPIFVNVYSAQACLDVVDTNDDGRGETVFRELCWEDTRGTAMYEDKWTDHDLLIE